MPRRASAPRTRHARRQPVRAQELDSSSPETLGLYATYVIVFVRLFVLVVHGIDFPTPS